MLAERSLSLNGQLATRVKNLGLKAKPSIEISLEDDQRESFVPSYTSLDEIKGEVSVTASCDTSFDDVYITFEGLARTYVEKIATTSPTNGRTEAFQNFLRLHQPMDPGSFPEQRILEVGKTYKFPFQFVVPERLLPQSCTHSKESNFPEGAHLNLPPSLGDPMVASMGKSLMDDFAPDMGTITYAIKCRMTMGRGSTGKLRILAEGSKKIRIIPTVPEQPPLSVGGGLQDDYRLRQEKSIKKGLFKGKLGRLVMASVQPQSLRLPTVRSLSDCSVTTMATVNVRFDPAAEHLQPPRLNTLQTKLKIATFYTSVPMSELPTKSSDFHHSSIKGIFVEALNLSSRCLANQQWETHSSSTSVGSNILSPSEAYASGTFYTATILIPISLPHTSKTFVPSFHSCLISRVYALDLYLSISTPNTTVTDPSLHIKLPIQISSEGNEHANSPISANEASAIASRRASDFFNPDAMGPPSPEYTEHAQSPQSPDPVAPQNIRAGQMLASGLSQITNQIMPRPAVRMNGQQQRFQSLDFEYETEGPEAGVAPPPEYSAFGSRGRERVFGNMLR